MERKIIPAANAFTLIELLVVIAIIGMLCTLMIPSLRSMRGGSSIGMAVETVFGTLTNARQLAVTKNREIEIRLIEMADPESPGAVSSIRAVQLIEVLEDGSYRPSKVRMLPSGTIINGTSALSSLSLLASATPGDVDPALPRVSKNYQYRCFRFRPDGSLNLKSILPAADTYYLTICEERFADKASGPANYATVQLEPATGAAVLYRP